MEPDGRIRILPPDVASKIAAGEVVERPASVVKELVENSLDAGATSVTVFLSEGGRRVVRVVDNGCGIGPDDAAVAFARNSTSKIAGAEDLYSIATLGFRGEALYSIASVAKVEVKTKRAGEVAGTRVVVEGGGDPVVEDAGCPDGTSIEVRDLFYNTPARLKFLRSPDTEFSRCSEVVRKAAIVNPGVRFRLVKLKPSGGESRTIDSPAGTLRERIADLFGADAMDGLMEVETPFISGFIGGPGRTWSTSRSVHVFVNGRAVTDRSVNRAIIDGYGSLLEGLLYPFAVINLTIPPADVDVNIHPTKSEVRFANQRSVYEAVKTAVRATLARGETSVARDGAGAQAPAARAGVPAGPGHGTGGRAGEATSRYGAGLPGRAWSGERGPWQGRGPGTVDAAGQSSHGSLDFATPPESGEDVVNPEFLALSTVGQLWGEFLIAQGGADGGDFYIIDQHGAAERCAFERLRKRYGAKEAPARQMLLLPERIEASTEETAAINEAAEELGRLGFEVEPFGPSTRSSGETFLVRSVPDILANRPAARLVVDVAMELAGTGGSAAAEARVESVLMTIACHSVIRGPRPLTREEGNALLRELSTIDFAAHCPHGRPVVKRYTRQEVESFFKR